MLKTVRVYLFFLIVTLILIDIYLVTNQKGFPTFSEVVKDQRAFLIGFTFLFGGLFSKIFYNRKTQSKKDEKVGIAIFGAIVLILSIIGYFFAQKNYEIETWHQLALLLTGGMLAHVLWPQFEHKHEANIT